MMSITRKLLLLAVACCLTSVMRAEDVFNSTVPDSTVPDSTVPDSTQPPSTEPPPTQPPSTEPPPTQPPSTQPPPTQPSSTVPPPTQPPSTEPPPTQPPSTEPPPTQPPSTEPPPTQPPSTEPPPTQPPSTEPPPTQPPSTQPPSTEPPPTQPPSTEPPSTQPPSTQPPSTQPPSTQPPSTQPSSTVPPSTGNPCDPNPCAAYTSCKPVSNPAAQSSPYLCIADGYRPGSCSANAYLSCDQYAQCIESLDGLSFTCQCQEGATGDGFKTEINGTGCKLPFKPCSDSSECPEYAFCDMEAFKCTCNEGFDGDGYTCEDINECLGEVCDEMAFCQNTPGSFTCTCNGMAQYVGDGYTCIFFCYNDNDCDVPRAKCIANNTCQCNDGYQGDGLLCTDIDECEEGTALDCNPNADCINQVGDYSCQCKNGFYGDGYNCTKRPQRCDDISNFKPGNTYTIDPDFTGPANAFDVICDKQSGIVVTKVPPTDTYPLAAPGDGTPLKINYKPSPSDMIPLTNGSVYCYQEISFSCYAGVALLPGTVWVDPSGVSHENWGSTKDRMCACGEVGACPSSCYCNGTQTQTLTTDSGQLVDKSHIPVVSIKFSQPQKDKGRLNIGPLTCALSPINYICDYKYYKGDCEMDCNHHNGKICYVSTNVPKDCHEAKFTYNIKKNTPLYIDVDGTGPLTPALVFCDMESYPHVGITSIPPNRVVVSPTTVEGEQVTYSTGLTVISALIKVSLFCSQYVEFQCKNSRLTNGGYVQVTGSKQRLSYFPGANGVENSCGCGATQSCDSPTVKCNCDIEDGQVRKDFGLIINKAHIPAVGLTAVIGDNKSGTYVLGNVQCSQKQFGIEPNCEKYRAAGGKHDNYTYFVDPDGPGGLLPFLVQCRFLQSPPQGVTIIHHTDEWAQSVTDKIWNIVYLQASDLQIGALKNRSTVCTQEVKLNCKQFSIQNPGAITWSGIGDGEFPLHNFLDTCGEDGQHCNCQSGDGVNTDSGTISDMEKLPVASFGFLAVIGQVANGGRLSITLGPLICSEVFPTCAVLKNFFNNGKAVEGESLAVNGRFTIDPDGPGGVEGFEVTCTFPTTVISIVTPVGGLNPDPNNPAPVSTCFDIIYKNENGDTISPAQITALVQKSGKCSQDLALECQNAPASKKVNYTSCNGQAQKGWAGSFGEDKCACGVNGNCIGGSQYACNCDMADDVLRTDSGTLINKTAMPVCQICFSINPIIPAAGKTGPVSMLKYTLGQLKCDTDQGTKTNCQDARQTAGTTIKTDQETAVSVNSNSPVPVGCRFYANPPMGILVVKATTPVYPPSTGSNTDIKVIYITANLTQVRLTFQDNEFCSQNIFLFNASALNLQLGGNWGFYSYDGQLSVGWAELNKTSKYIQKACQDYPDLYTKYGVPRGFSLSDKEELPVTRVVLLKAGVVVVIGDVECLDLKRSCQEILDTNSKTKGFIGGKRYVIDPDRSGQIDPFVVNCEFDQTNGNGVSEVSTSGQWVSAVTVTGKIPPANFSLSVEYNGVSAEQISALAEISQFCWQGIVVECRSTPLVTRTNPPSSYYDLYGHPVARSFGTGYDVDFPGCACAQTGTCVSNYSCNCDSLAPLAFDQGAVTVKSQVPITQIHVGGQVSSRSSAKWQVTGVRCSSLPIDPPRDCAAAQKIGSQFGVSYSYSAEYLISPSPKEVRPFMARCEFDFSPGIGVTVIKAVSTQITLNAPGTVTNITYHAPSLDQLLALIQQSKYCYQGVRYDCRASTLFSQGGYWLSAGSTARQTFWGGGQPGSGGLVGVCACGKDLNCGGLDSASGQRTRPCNCEYADNTSRVDAGIISLKDYLPISKFVVGRYAQFKTASLTVGDLYCSQEPLKFNECDLGFHDCHKIAACIDQDDGYRCVCPKGWNGKGVVVNSNQARANGRECIDDNECVAANPCPYSATCVNTPGSFSCVCKPGYQQTGPTSCQDINECLNSTLNGCDPNARCENLDGSYRCACNRGFRGDGRTCIPIGQCVCFGDPHCISYDNYWLHYQDACNFVMSQDGCQTGQAQTFRVEIETWRRNGSRPGQYAYVKSVNIQIFDKRIQLEQDGRIIVDGKLVRQFYDGHRFSITVVNQKIQLWTIFDLVVVWDGKDVVEITVPKNAKDNVCGVCGNYNGNPADDTVQGPACPATAGQQTDNEQLFAQSWIVQHSTCKANCRPDQPASTDDQCFYPKAIIERECNKLFDTKASPFKDCLKLKKSVDLQQFLDSCVYDLCHIEGDLDEAVCRFAEILAWDCSDNEEVNVIGWKSSVDACTAPTCPNNLVYKTCGNYNPRTCLTLDQQPSSQSGTCSEGCFCDGDLILENNNCIRPEQCGCFYYNSYMAIEDKVVLPDCSFEIQCVGNNVTAETPKGCGRNEECRTEDGITGCYCKEGFIQNSNDECTPDVCFKVECQIPNMACKNGTCVCKEGYIGDCNQCEDVDECATGISGCNLIGQTCLNTNGSFRCVCEQGYIGNGYICKDIDECEYQIDNCGDNSECVNTPGSFLCECCAGFSKSKTGACVRDTSAGDVAAKCCACQDEKCADSGKVCGTDGKTYSNYRSLSISACRAGNDQLQVNYKGPCKGTCETVICAKQYSTCQVVDGVPTCQCPTCADSSSSYEDITVCATNKITYISKCHMEAATCQANIETTVEVEHTGRPCPGNGPPLVGPWSSWSSCSEACKQGVQTRTRDVYVNSSKVSIHSVETIPCYSTCNQGPCQQDSCTGPAQVCVVDENNAPSCDCPICEDFPEQLICARLGNVVQTYPNECQLNKTACETREPVYEVLEPRACEEKPVDCGLIRKYTLVVDENGCKADDSINFGECYGGCDNEAEQCCYGNEVKQKSARMLCPDGSLVQKFFDVIVGCNCITKDEVNDLKMKIVQ